MLGDAPVLHKVGLQLQELGIRIAEHLLVLVVPLLACTEITQRQDVASLADSRRPDDGMTVFRRTGISIGVAHFGYKLVAHGYLQIRTLRDGLIEGCGTAVHKLIRQH